MGPKYLSPNQDFDFSSDFGFTGSAQGGKPTREHPDYEDESTLLGRRKGGKVKGYAMGGPMQPQAPQQPQGQEPTISMPMSTAQKTAQGLVKAGRDAGARQATQNLSRMATQRPPMTAAGPLGGAPGALSSPVAGAPPQVARQNIPPGVTGMKKGGFLKKAISRPGRETKRAAEHGVSVHEQMEHDSHSSDPSLRAAGNLGLRLSGGDLAKARKKG